EELESETGEPGEEQQADDVRVDQRREEACEEPGTDVDDGRALRMQCEVARNGDTPVDRVQECGERGSNEVDHVQLERLLRIEVRCLAHGGVGPLRVPAVRL